MSSFPYFFPSPSLETYSAILIELLIHQRDEEVEESEHSMEEVGRLVSDGEKREGGSPTHL